MQLSAEDTSGGQSDQRCQPSGAEQQAVLPSPLRHDLPQHQERYQNILIHLYFLLFLNSSETNATVWMDIIGEFANTNGGQRQRQELEDVEAGLTEALEAELRHETRVSSLGKTSKYNRYLLP